MIFFPSLLLKVHEIKSIESHENETRSDQYQIKSNLRETFALSPDAAIMADDGGGG